MSWDTQKWAKDQTTGRPACKALLIVLASYADEKHSCFPSQEELANITELSVRAVRENLKRLEDDHFIIRDRDWTRGRRRGLTRYVLPVGTKPVAQNHSKDQATAPRTDLDRQNPPLPTGPAVSDIRTGSLEPFRPADSDRSIREQSKEKPKEPPNDSRENARGREKEKPFKSKRKPIAPDLTDATKAFDGEIAEAYEQSAIGGKGAMGNRAKGIEALADLRPDAFADAVEAFPRYLRAIKAAHKHALTVVTYVAAETWKLHPRPFGTARSWLAVKPRSEEWCALFWALVSAANVTATRRARAMLREAQFGKNYYFRQEELPTAEDKVALVKIDRDGEEFVAWRRYLTWRRPHSLMLKGDAFGEWLWVPSRMPPSDFQGTQLGKDEKQGAAA